LLITKAISGVSIPSILLNVRYVPFSASHDANLSVAFGSVAAAGENILSVCFGEITADC
jgi:hypothetical protein